MPIQPSTDPIADLVNAPWYQSTSGPQFSSTLINLAATLIPMANLMLASHGINLLPSAVNGIITLAVFGFFAVRVAIRYVQTKHTLGMKLGRIMRANKDLAGALKEVSPDHQLLKRPMVY